MKILGIYSGRKKETTEFILKKVLMGALEEDENLEIEIVNLLSLDLKPCNGCKACHMFHTATVGDCVLKDDFLWLDNKIMESDALVVCMPIYEKTPPGEFKILMDRTGPSHDVVFRKHLKENRQLRGLEDGKSVDERSFIKRPAIFIAHGGTDWGSLAIPTMEVWSIPLGLEVVDLQYYPWNISIWFDEERIEQMKSSGRHLAKGLKKGEVEYIGPKGHCPVCHNSAMILHDENKIECAVCGIHGNIFVENEKIKTVFSEAEMKGSHYYDEGKEKHYQDLLNFGNIIKTMDMGELKKRKEESANWMIISEPKK